MYADRHTRRIQYSGSAGVRIAVVVAAQPGRQARAINGARCIGLRLHAGLSFSLARLLLTALAQQDFGVGNDFFQLRYGEIVQNNGHIKIF